MIIELEASISSIIKDLYKVNTQVTLISPPDKKLGDLTTNIALVLSGVVNKPPREIASVIAGQLMENETLLDIKIVGPGFINIFIDKNAYLFRYLTVYNSKSTLDQSYSGLKYGGKKISIEHTAANPNKSLHVGHLRNFSIADSLVRFFKHINSEVVVQYFNNNLGMQVAKVVWGVKNIDKLGLRDLYDNNTIKFDHVCAKIYVEAEKLSKDKDVETEISQILQDIESGFNENSRIMDEITLKILSAQLSTCFDFGVSYDEIITESAITRSKVIDRVLEELVKTGKVKRETEGKNAGCIVITGIFDQNKNSLPDKVLVRQNGTHVYTAKDIVLHLFKFGLLEVSFDFKSLEVEQPNNKPLYITDLNTGHKITENADLHINVVDTRQSYPLEVVRQSLNALGFNSEARKLFHLAYEVVSLSKTTALKLELIDTPIDSKSVAMSGRKGIEVSIDKLLDLAASDILAKNKNKEEKISYDESRKIAAGALRYYMVKYGYNTEIIFDLDEALKTDGNTGIYLMYAYVRASKILIKNVSEIHNVFSGIKLEASQSEVIFDVLKLLDQKHHLYNKVEVSFSMVEIANYLYELAKSFTAFYQTVSVLDEKDVKKKALFINFIKVFKTEYKALLEIIMPFVPERM